MPIYEYRCDHCGHELETIQKIGESPLTICPACGMDSLKKKISAAVFRLKGGGWYETDFKSDKKKNVASDDDSGAKAADNGAEAKDRDKKDKDKDKDKEAKADSGSDKPTKTARAEKKGKDNSERES